MKDKNSKRKILHFGLSFCILIFAFCLSVQGVDAASLYFSPSSGSYTIGQTFPISVYVSSADQAMNAASGLISFPQDKLEAVSLSKSGSIFNLWVQEPLFSNSAGTVNFEGIVLNPGFTGSAGKIITINFKAKAVGNAPLSFSSGSVLANDGLGTNILSSLGTANFSLSSAEMTPFQPPPLPTKKTPSAPIISSLTHPDSEKWYSNPNPKFSWQITEDITSVRVLYNETPDFKDFKPDSVFKPAISEKMFVNVSDGSWYLHVQLANKYGWGEISHFKFQIDTHPPQSFSIKFAREKETDNPQPVVLFETTDSLSGIDYYRLKIGEGDFFDLPAESVKDNFYILPFQSPGKRTITVQAFDKANNYTPASEEFTILPPKKFIFKIAKLPDYWSKIIFIIIILFLAILIVLVFAILIFLLLHLWRSFSSRKKQFKKESLDYWDKELLGIKEIEEFKEYTKKVLSLLHEDMISQIEILEKVKAKRELTEEEEKIFKKLMENLEKIEKFLRG